MILATFKPRSTLHSAFKKSSKKPTKKRNQFSSDEEDSEQEEDDEVVEIPVGIDTTGKIHGWLYIGSHNLTPSAWGTLSGSSFSPVLNVSFVIIVVVAVRSFLLVLFLLCTYVSINHTSDLLPFYFATLTSAIILL